MPAVSDAPDSYLDLASKRLNEGVADNDEFEPLDHAARFSDDVPRLAEVLRSEAVKAIASSYKASDDRAVERQARYKKYTTRANLLVALTAVLGALVAALIALSARQGEPGSVPYLVVGLSVLAAVTAASAAFLLNLLNNARYLRRWMEARAKAESERLAYFELVTNPQKALTAVLAPSTPADPDLHLLCFWYFLRYQYRFQKRYYEKRSVEHERSSEKNLRLAAAAVAVGMLASLLVPATSAYIGAWAALFGVVTVFGTALSSYSAAREAINQDQRNAERYERTGDILTRIGARIGAVEAAIRAGKVTVLADFVAAVHEQLSLEHRQWLETTEAASGALQRLNDSLSEVTAAEVRQ